MDVLVASQKDNRCSSACTEGSANQGALPSAGDSADQGSSASATANQHEIAPLVLAPSLEEDHVRTS